MSILNTAVRLVAGSSRRDHVTSLLRDRHWLTVKQRVEYKLCTIVHRCLYGDAPSYLPSRPHQAAHCCKCQSWSEICWVDDRRSATHAVIIGRPFLYSPFQEHNQCILHLTACPEFAHLYRTPTLFSAISSRSRRLRTRNPYLCVGTYSFFSVATSNQILVLQTSLCALSIFDLFSNHFTLLPCVISSTLIILISFASQKPG